MKNLHQLLSVPLPHSESQTKKRTLAVIDCETDPFKKGRIPQPFIWGFYDGENYEEFETQEQMLSWLRESEKYYRIYAHNGGKFDYHYLLDYMEPETRVMIINGRLSKFFIDDHEYRDSYNLFNFPLAAYKKDDFDYSIMEPEERIKPENKKKISKYLYKDCLYLYELVSDFIERYGIHLTQAGAAIKIWQKETGLKAPESSADYYDSMVQFYYGGRVQCFKKGIIKKEFQVIDITSAYPFAMLSNHPFSLEHTLYIGRKAQSIIDKEPEGLLSDKFSPAMFTINARSTGALPYRCPIEKKLIFPDDNLMRKFTVTGWEIQAGIRTNTLRSIRILNMRLWNETIDFQGYVNKFFKLKSDAKEAGDKLTQLFAKLFLNSLYGKFAADPRNYKSFTLGDPHNIEAMIEEGYQEGGFLGPWFLAKRDIPEEQQRFYNVATAASITGFVRAYLWEAICKCEGVLYCDTDSIAAHKIGNIPFGVALGDWEKEGDFDYGAIGGRKMYAFRKVSEKGDLKKNEKKGWKTASKGARLSPDQIIEVAKGKRIIYEPETPTFSVHHEPRFTNREIVLT